MLLRGFGRRGGWRDLLEWPCQCFRQLHDALRAKHSECTRTLSGHRAWIASVCLGVNGLLFSGDGKEAVHVWELGQCGGESLAGLRHPKGVYGLAVSPTDGSLATGCNDEHLRVWRPSIMVPAPKPAPGARGGARGRGAGTAAVRRPSTGRGR